MKIEEVKKLPALDRLLYWITERESIRVKKEKGLPRPWTDDTVLQTYFFCNVIRADDKVSRYLMDKWYGPHKDSRFIVAACCLARMFNEISTLEVIGGHLFGAHNTMIPFVQFGPVKAALKEHWKKHNLFRGAYIISGKKGEDKLTTVIDRCRKVAESYTFDTSSMEKSHAELIKYDGFGNFLAGQVVADARWAVTGEWADKKTWAPVGPGSKQGMDRLLSENFTKPVPEYDFLTELRKLMAVYRKRLPRKLSDRMEAQDSQSTLCEFSKYEKGLWGDRRVKRKYPGAA